MGLACDSTRWGLRNDCRARVLRGRVGPPPPAPTGVTVPVGGCALPQPWPRVRHPRFTWPWLDCRFGQRGLRMPELVPLGAGCLKSSELCADHPASSVLQPCPRVGLGLASQGHLCLQSSRVLSHPAGAGPL